MPLLINTMPDIDLTAALEATKKIEASKHPKSIDFDYEALLELVDQYYEENEYRNEARLRLVDTNLVLTLLDREDSPDLGVIVYYAENTPELFAEIDRKYAEKLLNDESSGNDFWDRWNSVLETFEPCKIVDDTFEE